MINFLVNEAARRLRPELEFSCGGDDSSKLVVLLNGEKNPDQSGIPTDAELSAEISLIEWEKSMQTSDKEDLPRWLEVHLESDHGGLTSDSYLQAKYNAKKLKRSQKP